MARKKMEEEARKKNAAESRKRRHSKGAELEGEIVDMEDTGE